MKPSEFKISISVKSYDKKTAENYRNCYVTEKRRVSKLSKVSIPNFVNTNWSLEWRWCQIFRACLSYFPRNEPLKSVTVGSIRFNILNDSACLKMVIKIYLKVLELFECCRGYPYMTANRNFVRFAHSQSKPQYTT